MPGVSRMSLDRPLRGCRASAHFGNSGDRAVPRIEASGKTSGAEEAYNPKGLVPRCVRELKRRFPEMGVITDVALDPYTIARTGRPRERRGLRRQRRDPGGPREAGADPCRGRRRHRGAVGHDGWPDRGAFAPRSTPGAIIHVRILAYSAKYASGFYGPFRDAVGSGSQPGQGRQEDLPDGSGKFRRGAARGGPRPARRAPIS